MSSNRTTPVYICVPMMRAILPPLLGVVLLTAVCPIAAAQDSLRVTLLGQVFAEETGKPLAGAHVFIAETRYGSATDAYGIYRIDGVPLGLGDLVVSMPGYAPQTVTVHITEQAEYRYNVKLTKTDDPKQAWATWAQGLAALADAEQLDVRQADAFVHSVFQDEDEGRYEQAAAVYLALLERLDTAPSKEEQKIIARQVAQVEFLLPDDVRAEVIEVGYLRGQGTLRFKEGAGAKLARWWRAKDPLLTTSRNERLETHLQRVAYASRRYSHRQSPRGFDDRGQIYVRLGPPTFHQRLSTGGHITQALLEISGPMPPDAEIWTYPHLDLNTYYLFILRDGRYQISEVHDLIPAVLRRGLSDTPRGNQRAQILISFLHGAYRQMLPLHPDFADLFDEIDLYRDGVGDYARVKPVSFARTQVAQTRFQDFKTTELRRQLTPLDHAPLFGEAGRLPIEVRYARFLNDDGATRTEIYAGHLPVPEAERTPAEKRAGPILGYRIESTLVLWDEDYRERIRRQSRYTIPASGQTLQTLVLQGDTATYHVTAQWDASAAGTPSTAPRLRTGVFRAEGLHPLNDDAATLEMSDLKPVFASAETDVIRQTGADDRLDLTPYPFTTFVPDAAPSLYFEIYHLTFGADDQTHYTIEYEVVRRTARLLGLLGTKEERTLARTSYTGRSRTVREFITVDLSQWEQGGESLSIIIRITDDTTGRQVERHIDFSL